MTTTLTLSYTAALALIILLQADYQANRFKQNKTINHIGKSAIYCVLSGAIGIAIMWGRWHEYEFYWKIPTLIITARAALFDLILNILRSKRWLYIGRGTSGSLQAKIEGELNDFAIGLLRITFYILFIANIIIDIKL